jgi:hypothetical protein
MKGVREQQGVDSGHFVSALHCGELSAATRTLKIPATVKIPVNHRAMITKNEKRKSEGMKYESRITASECYDDADELSSRNGNVEPYVSVLGRS